MTTQDYALIASSSIKINRPERQRRELTGIQELADSIASVGLINPILIDRANNLVAGERRLSAMLSLNWDSIPCQFTDQIDPTELHLLELEENVKREQLSWPEQVAAVQRYHELKSETQAGWDMAQTAEALSVTPETVSRNIAVAKAIASKPELSSLPSYSTALNIVRRDAERKKSTALAQLSKTITAEEVVKAPAPLLPVTSPDRKALLLNENSIDWMRSYSGPAIFNFIHLDFPYGVSAGDKQGQSMAKVLGGYADSPDVYWNLVSALTEFQSHFIADSAHMMFWFSMDYYTETKATLELAGWVVNPFPLIWHKSDNKGILPDPNRGPRRIYETALFCTRGDRLIVGPVANSFSAPTTKDFHMSEKPVTVLSHFFRMFVDEHTTMIDLTCGGANAVKVSENMGATYSLGIEMSAEYFERATVNLGL